MKVFNFPEDVTEWNDDHVQAAHDLCAEYYQIKADLFRSQRRARTLEIDNNRLRGQLNQGLLSAEGWGWSRGIYSYGNLRDMLSAAGSKDWDLSTSREDLEKMVHIHVHKGSPGNALCPGCKAERSKA